MLGNIEQKKTIEKLRELIQLLKDEEKNANSSRESSEYSSPSSSSFPILCFVACQFSLLICFL